MIATTPPSLLSSRSGRLMYFLPNSVELPSRVLSGHYDLRLVSLSVLIAIVASFATLDLASRVQTLVQSHFIWLVCGAVSMGSGIWAMHYIGMYAYDLPVPVLYDLPTVLLSMLAAIFVAAIALWIVSRSHLTVSNTVFGSIAMGSGIASMHYIGMAAMRLPAMCVYSRPVVALSVVLAIVISYAALHITSRFRDIRMPLTWRKFVAAIVLGLAIPVMHYVGMAAVTFISVDHIHGNVEHAVAVSSLGLLSITAITIILLGTVILRASSGRKIAQQQQEIADKATRTQVIFDSLKEGVVVLDRERNFLQINQAAKRMLGLDNPSLSHEQARHPYEVRLPNGDLLPPSAWPGALAQKGEFLQNCELHITRTDTGLSIITEVSTAPILDPMGKLAQIIISYRDVTQPREIDDARVRLAAIVESSEDAIIGKDLSGNVTSWNLGAEKLFGYTTGEMIGHSIRILLPVDRLQEEDDIITRVQRGEIAYHLETIRRRKNGQFINVSLTISPIRDINGMIVGASKIARNITDRKLMESRMYQTQKMEAIGQLTGGIAHDFNNLLGVIIGNLDLLERRVTEDEVSLKRVHTAQKAATRGAELTKRLLTFASREQLSPAPIHIENSIRATLELASRALGPEVSIITHFQSGLPLVLTDEGGLENALLNILFNAHDAMSNGGQITITTHKTVVAQDSAKTALDGLKPGSYVLISISDTGHGMSHETIERAFEPFYTTKERDKGTGLGLAMVYGFFKQSGGTVRLYSEFNYGTTVSCYLPIDGSHIQHQPNLLNEADETASDDQTILLVDDETDLLEIASAYLKNLGYTVFSAVNGADALALVQQHPEIDLVITDVIMPEGLNGADLAQQLRSLRPRLSIIYASGFPADALAERKLSLADGPLLHKPYQRHELISLVRRVLKSQSRPQTIREPSTA